MGIGRGLGFQLEDTTDYHNRPCCRFLLDGTYQKTVVVGTAAWYAAVPVTSTVVGSNCRLAMVQSEVPTASEAQSRGMPLEISGALGHNSHYFPQLML